MDYKLVLGLEIHLHLKTDRKMFCGCEGNIYGAQPNTHTCPVCLGLPGALPIPNYDAVVKTQLLGLALHCKLNKDSKFDRKHYFYPDLPKGYQISQYKQPLCGAGFLDLDSGYKAEIRRVHLEEDVAKSLHRDGQTLIDFNKSGMPLVEIVTEPTFKNVEDAVDFCKQVQEIVRALEIGDVDMEKGQMRLEANISMRTKEMESNNELPDYRVEIKNINSFRFMEKAVKAEMVRQSELLSQDQKVPQENRGYDENTGKTVSQRDKEEANDYRYFPEPDIPPMQFDSKHFGDLQSKIPELPYDIKKRYLQSGLSAHESAFLASFTNKEIKQVFEDLVDRGEDAKKVAKLLVNKPETWELTLDEIVKILTGPQNQISDNGSLQKIIQQVVEKNPLAIEDYKKGKTNSIEFLLGQIMRETKGKADIVKTRELLIKTISG